jgi:tetratricopeptide (TPR) repeat protein
MPAKMSQIRPLKMRFYCWFIGLLGILWIAVFLIKLVVHDSAVVEPTPPPVSQLLESLQEDPDDESPIDVAGRYCLELMKAAENEAGRRLGLTEIRAIGMFLATKSSEEALPLLKTLLPEIPEKAATARALIETHLARVAFSEGDPEEAGNHSRRALALKPDECVSADADYLLGRIAAKSQDSETALKFYVQATKRLPNHIPALLEIVRIGLKSRDTGPLTFLSAEALLRLGRIRGARIYALSLLREIERYGCRSEGCLYLRAVLENWAELPGAGLRTLDQIEGLCRSAPLCDRRVLSSAATFRVVLEEKLTSKQLREFVEP